MKHTPNLTKTDWVQGMVIAACSLLLLPQLLSFLLAGRINDAQLNLLTYFASAGLIVFFWSHFLRQNLRIALYLPLRTIYISCLGYLGNTAITTLINTIMVMVFQDFTNLNDATVTAMLLEDTRLIVVTVVILAPIVEECFYRGLLFRGIYDRNPAIAWVCSVGLFAASHVVGYLGIYTPLELLLSFVQYLTPGIILCITYQRTGTIMGPMLTHALINAMAIYATLR